MSKPCKGKCKFRTDGDGVFCGCKLHQLIDNYCDDAMYETCPDYEEEETNDRT